MVRVWLRPCAAAIKAASRQAVTGARAQAPRALLAHSGSDATPFLAGIRTLSTKGKDKKEVEKKKLSDKFEENDDPTELPEEVKYLSQELDDDLDGEDEDEEDLENLDLDDLDLEDLEDLEDDDDALDPQEWAEKFEREVAEWDDEDGEDEYENEDDDEYEFDDDELDESSKKYTGPLEDDRLYIEMPGYDASLSLAENNLGMEEEEVETRNTPDPFRFWNQGDAVAPEMLNWMLPADKRRPFTPPPTKPWKYFVKANHQDIVELALDVDLLRLFISPTGRIRPRRFTGLTAKQQRKLAQAVKISRQLALLPYLSRYPEPTPEQWKAMEEEDMARALAELADDDGKDDDDDDDDDFDEDMEYQ